MPSQPLNLLLDRVGHARDGVCRRADTVLNAVDEAQRHILAHLQEVAREPLYPLHTALKLGPDRGPARFERRADAAFREDGGDKFLALLE